MISLLMSAAIGTRVLERSEISSGLVARSVPVLERDRFRPYQAPFAQDTSGVRCSADSARDGAPKPHFSMTLPTSDSIGKLHLRFIPSVEHQGGQVDEVVNCGYAARQTHAFGRAHAYGTDVDAPVCCNKRSSDVCCVSIHNQMFLFMSKVRIVREALDFCLV